MSRKGGAQWDEEDYYDGYDDDYDEYYDDDYDDYDDPVSYTHLTLPTTTIV